MLDNWSDDSIGGIGGGSSDICCGLETWDENKLDLRDQWVVKPSQLDYVLGPLEQ
jgi:hypothetical protein